MNNMETRYGFFFSVDFYIGVLGHSRFPSGGILPLPETYVDSKMSPEPQSTSGRVVNL